MREHMTESVTMAVKSLCKINDLTQKEEEILLTLFSDGFQGTFKELIEVSKLI